MQLPVDKLRQLLELTHELGLTELILRKGDDELVLRGSATQNTPPMHEVPAIAPGVTIEHGPATLFRWTDQDWIVRVELTFTNESSEAATVSYTQFTAVAEGGPMYPWPPGGDMPTVFLLNGNETRTVAAAWFRNRMLPAPEEIELRFGVPDAPRWRATIRPLYGTDRTP